MPRLEDNYKEECERAYRNLQNCADALCAHDLNMLFTTAINNTHQHNVKSIIKFMGRYCDPILLSYSIDLIDYNYIEDTKDLFFDRFLFIWRTAFLLNGGLLKDDAIRVERDPSTLNSVFKEDGGIMAFKEVFGWHNFYNKIIGRKELENKPALKNEKNVRGLLRKLGQRENILSNKGAPTPRLLASAVDYIFDNYDLPHKEDALEWLKEEGDYHPPNLINDYTELFNEMKASIYLGWFNNDKGETSIDELLEDHKGDHVLIIKKWLDLIKKDDFSMINRTSLLHGILFLPIYTSAMNIRKNIIAS